jgi:predicted permease
MRLLFTSLILIVVASFFHSQVTDFFSLSVPAENSIYRNGMFWAAAIGGYGAVVTVLGFILAPRKNDAEVRLLPLFMGITVMIFLFFYLLSDAMNGPSRDEQRRLRPGDTITI